MSLHKFAEQVASQGRGDDSLLVHMTPDEVRNLQQFAQANGTTLTINPVTGLPEAGLLSDLFKSIAPIALGAFLGPAGLGMSSMMAGVATGGITTLATGSLSRGLMAGLGAYGGAGLGESFMTAGGGMSAANAATAAQGQLGATNLALGEALPAQAAEQFTQDAITRMTPSGAVSAGFNKAIASPGAALDFAKGNLGNLAYAAAPIMAGAMVPTTTKLGDPKDTGYIRQMAYNINPETGRPDPLYGMREMTPVKTSDWKDKTFQGQRDLFYQQNPNPYNIGVASLNQPPQQQPNPMATGGIVALARGGVAHYEGGGGINEYDYAPGGGDAALAAYQAGNYEEANRLLGESGMGAQDVVDKYGLSQADAATVAQNLGYKGDMGGIQYAPPAAAAPTPTYFTQNPDVAAAFTQNSYGMTPEQFAQAHYTNYGQAEGRTIASNPVVDTGGGLAALNTAATNTAATTPVTDTGGGLAALNTTATTAATTTPYYFQVNPDVAAEYARNPLGLTPEQFAQAHYTNFGQKEGREFVPSAAASYAKANNQDLVTNTLKWIDTNPFATPEQINAAIKGSGMSTGDVNRALDSLVASGKISGSERYYIQQGKGLSAMADSTAKWLKDNPNATQTQIDAVLKAASMDTGDAQQVLAHGFQVADKDLAAATKYIQDNPDVARWITSDQGKAYIKEHPEFDAKDIAFTHYKRYGEKEGRQWGATPPVVKPPVVPPIVPPFTSVVPGGTQLPGATVYNNGAFGNYGSGPATGVDYLGNTVSIATPGDIISNPDNSRTVVPNVPGRPYGGFTGVEQLRSRYTAGGGKLGYTSPVQKDPATYYNKLTDGSLDAYNYLMGKGKNLTQRKPIADRPVMQRYDEAVLGRKDAPRAATVAGDTLTVGGVKYNLKDPTNPPPADSKGSWQWDVAGKRWAQIAADGTVLSSGGGDGPTGPSGGNNSNTISGFTPGLANPNISDVNMSTMSPAAAAAAAASAADSAAAAAASATGNAPGSDGSPGSGAKNGGMIGYAMGGGLGSLGSYSDGGRLLRGPGDGVSDSIPATIGRKQQPARLADGEFVIPARIVSELGNGSTDAGAKKLYAMMDRVQRARGKTTGKNKVAANSRADKYLPA